MKIDVTGDPTLTITDSYSGVVFRVERGPNSHAQVRARRIGDSIMLTLLASNGRQSYHEFNMDSGALEEFHT